MQPSSENPRGRFRWYSAAALALLSVLPPAFADSGDTVERRDRSEEQPLSTQNKCNGDQVEGRGTVRTEDRMTTKRDGTTEHRIRTREQGEGQGAPSLSRYTWNRDTHQVFRMGGNRPNRITDRSDERVIAHDPNVPSWFFTARLEIRDNEVVQDRERCRCKKDDGAPQSVDCETGQAPAPSQPLIIGGLPQ